MRKVFSLHGKSCSWKQFSRNMFQKYRIPGEKKRGKKLFLGTRSKIWGTEAVSSNKHGPRGSTVLGWSYLDRIPQSATWVIAIWIVGPFSMGCNIKNLHSFSSGHPSSHHSCIWISWLLYNSCFHNLLPIKKERSFSKSLGTWSTHHMVHSITDASLKLDLVNFNLSG